MNFIPTPEFFSKEYSILYLPPVVYGYLYSFAEPTQWELLGWTIPSHEFFLYASLISLIGCLMIHKIFILLFGHEGPKKNPKHRSVIIFYSLQFVSGAPARDLIKDPEIRTWGEYISGFTEEWGLWNILQFSILVIPIGFAYLSFYIATGILFFEIWATPQHDVLGVVLLIVSIAFLLQSRIWKWFPNYVKDENLDKAKKPEYEVYLERIGELEAQTSEATVEAM